MQWPFTQNYLSLAAHTHTRTQVVEDGYEFFARRQLVTLFSAPNYCGDYDNAGGMMTVDEDLMCSFQVRPSVTDKIGSTILMGGLVCEQPRSQAGLRFFLSVGVPRGCVGKAWE